MAYSADQQPSGLTALTSLATDDVFIVGDTSDASEVVKKITKANLILDLGGGVTDGDKGDITVSGTGTTWTIDNDVVTYAKMQNVSATDRILGRDTAGAGDAEELTVSGGLEFTGTGIQRSALTGAVTASAGSNTTALGSFTKAQLDTAVSDGNVLYVGDITQYTDELAQDAVGAMVATSIVYNDAGATLQRAALTGAITASQDSNATSLGSFTLSALNTAVSDANIIPEAGGTFTGDISVPDEAYGVGWNGSVEVPTKNAVYDKIETISAGGSNTYFNTVFVDQSGGTSDTYGAISGTINGSNAVFTVSQGAYSTGTLKVYLNGQLQTQGSGEDWTETTPASGTFTFVTAPATGSLITVEYQRTTTTTGGGITLAENASIALDPAGSADGKYTGITMTATGGATIAFGDLLYLDAATSRWKLTDADASATAGPVDIAMAVTSSTDGTAVTLLRMGNIRADSKFPALTIGAPVYVGETAGAIQVAIPTGADNVIRVVGFALTADEIYFNPSPNHQLTVA